ncbi:PREDICTED: zinc finger protein SNAI2 isoform X2 [Acanthisitta chloris]|uniref:zinc finger protein SNAI2 isoform X2 n=1 Tax=Acanthisitta chloris TaxID=57068 RepID=UPI0004F0D3AC|nr:PREDICTED: zinc finger protein SNAI2 isoform X2 [Acanthisitta chloris]
MPRSFLVKKHFNSSKKPNYSELDTHTVIISPYLYDSYPVPIIPQPEILSSVAYNPITVWTTTGLLPSPLPNDLSPLSGYPSSLGRVSPPPASDTSSKDHSERFRPLAMKKRESSRSFPTLMQSKLKSFSAVYAARPIQLSLGWPNISSCTVMPSLGNHSAASTVTRSMSAWERLRCTSGPTHYLVSARSAARLSLDPGCFKDTFELTLERSRFPVLTATGLLQTDPI